MKFNSTLVLICALAILPFLSIFFTPALPHTSDGGVQIPRMAAFYKAVRDGHIPVRWAGDLNYGYGMPLFDFIYHTPFYLSTVLIWIGIPLVLTFKLVLFASFLLSGIAMYLFAREFFHDDQKALFITILYQFAPYHLVDILTRGTIGTIYVYAFFPFMLLGITKVIHAAKQKSYLGIVITSLSTALMILSHNSMALIFFGISVLFVLFFGKKIHDRIISFLGLGLGLSLSAFYWIPALFDHKYTYGDLFMKDLFKVNFPPFQNFFIPNLNNASSLRVSEVAVQWGIIHSLVVVFGIFLMFRWKKISSESKRIILFCFCLLFGSVIFMNSVSTPIWEHISFLRQFQFPWRLLSVVIFATSFLSCVLFDYKKFSQSKIPQVVMILAVVTTVFYWIPTQGFDTNINENDFWNYPLNTTYFGETDVIWSAGPAKQFPSSRIEVIEGKSSVTNLTKTTQQQTFSVTATTDSRLVSNTQYFPGWKVYVDGHKTPIEFQDQNWRGLITFPVSSGNHLVKIKFEETPIRLISDGISILGIFFLGFLSFISKKWL